MWQFYQEKQPNGIEAVDFSWIRTRTVGVEGDHLTSTAEQGDYWHLTAFIIHFLFQGGAMERFLDMHMYITSALQKTDMKAVGLQLALDLLHKKVKNLGHILPCLQRYIADTNWK